MCGPAALAGVGMGAQGIGAGLGAYGAHAEGVMQQRIKDWEALQAENNAVIARYQAKDAAWRGEIEVQDLNKAYDAKIGEGTLAFAGGNVKVGTGSAGRWAAGMEQARAEDVLMSQHNTAMDVWSLETQAQQLTDQAKMDRWAGRQYKRAGNVRAVATALGGAGSLAGGAAGMMR